MTGSTGIEATEFEIKRLRESNESLRARVVELKRDLAAADLWVADHCDWVSPEAYAALRARVAELEAKLATYERRPVEPNLALGDGPVEMW